MSEPIKPSVPKFASFRPKPVPVYNGNLEARKDSHYRTSDERERKSGHAEGLTEQESRAGRRSSRGSRSKERAIRRDFSGERHHRGRGHSGNHERNPLSINVQHEELFKVDRKGDAANVQYGKLHRYSIPQYRRFGHGFLIGLGSSARIERSNDDELIVAPRHFIAKDRPNYESHRWKDSRVTRLIHPESSDEGFDHAQDFIATARPKKRRKLEKDDDDDPVGLQDYRALLHKQDVDQAPDESDLEYAFDSPTEQESEAIVERVKSENARLTRMTVDEPNNARGWLDLIDLQEDMLFLGQDSRRRNMSANDRRTLADVRTVIYDRAINAVKSDENRIRLIIKHLDEVSEWWENKDLEDRWKETLRTQPHSTDLWMQYLDFVQGSFTSYRYEACKDSYLECLKMVSRAISISAGDAKTVENLQNVFIHVFTCLTSMVREAGYRELAVALWQAILEFFVLRPSDLNASTHVSRVDGFERFWDSEVARIGDIDTAGWNRFDLASAVPAPNVAIQNVTSSGDAFARFAQIEEDYTRQMRHPGRTSDELGADDPYHVVLFSDISEALSAAPAYLPPLKLVQGYLCFAGLPSVAGVEEHLTHDLSLDPYLQRRALELGKYQDQELLSGSCVQTTVTLLDWAYSSEQPITDGEWHLRTLEILAKAFVHDTALAEYYLALTIRLQSTKQAAFSAVRAAKALLKARPHCLRLYNSYGIIEARSGKPSYHKVFATALSVSKSFSEEAQRDAILLWRTWIWEALRSKEWTLAAGLLHSVGKSELHVTGISNLKPSAETWLRSSKLLAELRDQAMSTGHPSHAVLATECHALLHYLRDASNGDIQAALGVYELAERQLGDYHLIGSVIHAALRQAQSQLLLHHMRTSRRYKPATIRDALAESVKLFPNNTLLLSAFAESEARFRIDDRVRTAVSDILGGRNNVQETIITHAFAIATEMQRLKNLTGTEHAVRAAYERAVNSRAGRHCPALWSAYLQFELAVAGSEMRVAKDVFFKGMTKLPWCKTFMIGAFSGKLRGAMSDEELMRVYNVMEEKELRLFADLHELREEDKSG